MRQQFNLIFICILGIFVFTGCTTMGLYTPDYVSYNLDKNKKRVEDKKIVINKRDTNILTKKPDSVRGSITKIEMHTDSINTEVLKEFFSQYFSDVELSNSKGFLTIDSEILDYNYAYGTIADGVSMDIKTKISVYKENKMILSKTYNERVDNQVILTLNLDLKDSAINTFHKGLLWIYESKFKPDLLKALKENL